MTLHPDRLDFPRLVGAMQIVARWLGLAAVPDAALESTIRTILLERELLEAADEGLITKQEAVHALVARVQTWLEHSYSRPAIDLSDRDWPTIDMQVCEALFGDRSDDAAIGVSRS